MSSPDHDAAVEGASNAEPIVDLLAEAASRAGVASEVVDQLAEWLAKKLEDDRFAQLERAGHAVEDRIPLARVFVDLEVAALPVGEANEEHVWTDKFVHFLNQSREVRWEEAAFEATGAPSAGDQTTNHESGCKQVEGYVLIGGPGQGKSTLGQLLCQIHRAWLLRPRIERVKHEQRTAIESFSGERAIEELGRPAEVRFPIRFVLADAADWLSSRGDTPHDEGVPELLAYLIEREKCPLLGVDLLRVLAEIDWLLVLDGLDEVPISSNRDRLLGAVQRLVNRLSRGARRGLLLTTTRPQGYSGEFDQLGVRLASRYIAPFSRASARAYAERLVQARFTADRRATVLQRLEQAAAGDATARLMRTPLQVTILATLVDRIGRAPSGQWTLFHEYYRVIYEREMERPFELAELLRLYQKYIDKIHAHVGLILQVEAEQSGGTGSALSSERFGRVVDAILAEDEIESERRRDLVERLERAVRERLVLLVELQPGRLGFEVRSIQEFMAAWALSQREAEEEARLAQIAIAASFRNVVLFLASKAFTELSVMRDAFTDRICPRLNAAPDDPLVQAALVGSVVALEILEEGSGLKQTKYVRKLVELASRLVELPPSQVHKRLARACLADDDARRSTMPILERVVRERIAASVPEQRLGAWAVLLALMDAGEAWAQEVADTHWKDSPKVRSNIIEVANRAKIPFGGWFEGKLLSAPEDISPLSLSPRVLRLPGDRFRALRALGAHTSFISINIISGGQEAPLTLKLMSPELMQGSTGDIIPWAALSEMPHKPPKWAPFIAAARFVQDPTAQTLSNELVKLADVFDGDYFRGLKDQVPWPLSACLGVASTPEELRGLAARASAGELGDTHDWLDAEALWKQQKVIELNELVTAPGSTWPFSKGVQVNGVPLAASRSWWVIGSSVSDAWLRALRGIFANADSPTVRTKVAKWIIASIHHVARDGEVLSELFTPSEIRALWLSNPDRFPIQILSPVQPWMQPDAEWVDLLDEIGKSTRFGIANVDLKGLPQYVSRLYVNDPSRTGLVHILKLLIAAGGRSDVPRKLLEPERFADERTRNSAQLLLLAQGDLSAGEAEQLAAQLARSVKGENRQVQHIPRILEHMAEDFALRDTVVAALWQNIPPTEWELASELANDINTSLRRRKSGLDDPLVWDRLHLPLPRPERNPPVEPPPSAERRPTRIELIHLQNVRGFDELRLAPAAATDDAGQWLVLVGVNGVGKSTILRSLVFALVDLTSQPNRLPRSTFEAPWRNRGAKEEEPARILITVHGNTYGASVESRRRSDLGGDGEHLKQDGSFLLSPVFAYGCRRGSALGGASRKVDSDPGAEVPTLFDEGADLIHAETWLLLKENAALKEAEQDGPARRLYQEILKTLCDILPGVDSIEGRGERVWVRGSAVGEVLLAALSDGYLTTVGWVVDLIARWIRRMEIRKETIPADFTNSMTGLVLIDEIDLHLHPEWQRRVIDDVRRIFPRMSFVATTHNPLTLLGARAEEIWMLEREDGRVVAKQGQEQPALMTGSDIYDTYFGIRSTFPDELGAMLDRYGFLARDPVRSDEEDAEMRDLLTKLQEHGVEPSWQPVPREAFPPFIEDEPV